MYPSKPATEIATQGPMKRWSLSEEFTLLQHPVGGKVNSVGFRGRVVLEVVPSRIFSLVLPGLVLNTRKKQVHHLLSYLCLKRLLHRLTALIITLFLYIFFSYSFYFPHITLN